MEFGFFKYTCDFWNEEEKKIKTVHGLVYSDTFANAMYELEKYYGCIENVKLQGEEPSNIYEFKK